MRTRQRAMWGVMGAMWLAACATAPTPVVIVPTLPPVVTRTPAASATTIAPSETPPPTRTPRPTLRPTATPFPTATPRATAIPASPTQAALDRQVLGLSPNRWWEAALTGEARDDRFWLKFQVTRADGQVQWVAEQEWADGLGGTRPGPLLWSADGQYLYYTNVPTPDGCALFANGTDLWRMDLGDGTTTQLVPEVGLALALSPDEQTLAYIGRGPQLVLRDLASGAERVLPLPADTQAGGIVWSWDSSLLMLTVATNPCTLEEDTEILKVEVATLAQTVIPLPFGREWRTVGWGEAGLVLLRQKGREEVWGLNPADGTVSEYCGWCGMEAIWSANRAWVAFFLERTSENAEMEVLRVDGTQHWRVSELYEREGYLWPLGWSLDGRYFYFTRSAGMDGCSFGGPLGTSLKQLDLTTGQVTTLDPQLPVQTLAPDAKWLLYKEAQDIVVLDLTMNNQVRQTMEAYQGGPYVGLGNFVWSPDAKQLVMLVKQDDCDPDNPRSAVVLLERATLQQQTLLADWSHHIWIQGWTAEDKIWLRDDERHYWLLNPLTGELNVPAIVPQTIGP